MRSDDARSPDEEVAAEETPIAPAWRKKPLEKAERMARRRFMGMTVQSLVGGIGAIFVLSNRRASAADCSVSNSCDASSPNNCTGYESNNCSDNLCGSTEDPGGSNTCSEYASNDCTEMNACAGITTNYCSDEASNDCYTTSTLGNTCFTGASNECWSQDGSFMYLSNTCSGPGEGATNVCYYNSGAGNVCYNAGSVNACSPTSENECRPETGNLNTGGV